MDKDFADLPAWVREPVLLALADLQDPDGAGLALEWRAEGDDAGTLVAGEPVNASQRFQKDDAVPANVIVAVAGWLQDQLFPDPAVPRAHALPVCPEHDHPMQAKNLYDVAWWFCPASESPIRLIGES